jgi:hypothetical protein
MSNSENREEADTLGESQASASAALRIVLDKDASIACDQMIQALKSEGPIRLSSSKLASFVLARFFSLYFEKDKDLLLAEFFDSKCFVEEELRKATGSSDVSGILERTTLKVRKMQELKKRGIKTATSRKTING